MHFQHLSNRRVMKPKLLKKDACRFLFISQWHKRHFLNIHIVVAKFDELIVRIVRVPIKDRAD